MDSDVIEKGFQRVWQMFQESKQETEALRQMFKESKQELDQMFKESREELDQRFKESKQELDQRFKETGKEIERTTRSVEAFTGKWGRFVEGLIVPGAIRMFKERGIAIERIFQRVKAHKNGDATEIDILGVNTEYTVLIEVKSTLSVDDVREHIERMKVFKRFFPEYADRKVIGAVAGIVIDGNADKFAYRQGFFVIGQTGETASILNDSQFIPKIW